MTIGERSQVRKSATPGPFRWHHHPDSDETFLGVEGRLIIEFEQREIVLRSVELVTVPKGVRHRTRPEGERSVNLTFERQDAAIVFDEYDFALRRVEDELVGTSRCDVLDVRWMIEVRMSLDLE